MRTAGCDANQRRRDRRAFRLRYRLGVAVLTAALSLSAAVGANEMESFVDRMPRAYSGEFRFSDDQPAQSIAMTFDEVRAISDQKAEALGCAGYEAGRETTKLKVRMFIRLSDLRVEIWEESPRGNTRIEAGGNQQGHFSEDLQRIDAQSVAGLHGRLQLRAVSSAVCAPMTSL
jgi:hypothetical protein